MKLATESDRARWLAFVQAQPPIGRPPAKYDCGSAGMLTQKEIADRAGLTKTAISNRIRRGITGESLLVRDLPARDAWATRRREMMARIEDGSTPVPETGCWIWLQSLNTNGYAQMSVDGITKRVSRIVLGLVGRPVPPGMYACHKCDTPSCVNPDHLFIGSATDNARDRQAKGRGRRPR